MIHETERDFRNGDHMSDEELKRLKNAYNTAIATVETFGNPAYELMLQDMRRSYDRLKGYYDSRTRKGDATLRKAYGIDTEST